MLNFPSSSSETVHPCCAPYITLQVRVGQPGSSSETTCSLMGYLKARCSGMWIENGLDVGFQYQLSPIAYRPPQSL